jgi:hypothetical protein
LLGGIGFGAVNARIDAIVVLVEEFRLTMPASGSVPVFTDQRSTPHCENKVEGKARTAATTSKDKRRTLSIAFSCVFLGPFTLGSRLLLEDHNVEHRVVGLKASEKMFAESRNGTS